MLRVIGGSLRGRRFAAPAGRHTRPTADKVREAIFNALASLLELEGARVIDLFAGSGALGIEALSRGAAHCTFVESHGRTAGGIRANLQALGLPPATWRVVTARAESWLRDGGGRRGAAAAGAAQPATLVLADPPYGFGEPDALLAALAGAPLLAPDALIVLEAAAGQALSLPASLELVRTKGYGDTQVSILGRTGPATARPQP